MRNKKLIIIFSILLSITSLVLLTSIIFSVKTVTAYCHNYKDYIIEQDGTSLNKRVLDSVDIKGKSIFLLNDEEIIEQIEGQNPTIKVIYLLRLPPNRLEINYIKMYNYFEAESNGKYYQLRCDGRITEILASPSTENRIRIVADFDGQYEVGDYLFSEQNGEFLSEAVVAFERLNLGENRASTLFEYMDISTTRDIIYIKIRNTDTLIKIFNYNNFLEKLQAFYTYYNSDEFDDNVKLITIDNNLSVFPD